MDIKDLELLIEIETINEAALDYIKQINSKFGSFFEKNKTIRLIKSLKNISKLKTEDALKILKQFYDRGPKIDPDKNDNLVKKSVNDKDFDKIYRRAFDGLFRMTKGKVPNSVLKHCANLMTYLAIVKKGDSDKNVNDLIKDSKKYLDKQNITESTNLSESIVSAAASLALLSFFSILIINTFAIGFSFGSLTVVGLSMYLIIGSILYTFTEK